MKKTLLLAAALLLCLPAAKADDGMWLPCDIAKRIADMQAKGFRLSAEDVYSINQASLKDAVVHFNGGCTGELISDEGLLITNYHCGYSQIQAHSSVDHDYLRDGFWAMTIDQELPNNNLFVRFLVRMEDVSAKVLAGYDEGMTESQRDSLVKANGKPLIEAARKEGAGYSANIQPLYYGNQYFMWVYQTFTDVRLVGAPPTAIGKFGGDTDNWMWPRHTGDFSLFRIYADKDNNPAPYSPDNVPYRPRKHFKMSVKERNEGDFTFVYGYPGRTQEYIYSEAVRYISEVSDPEKHDLRSLRLDVQHKYMSQDQKVRIQYSAKNASVSNAWKKWFGEMKGIRKMKAYENKKEFEAAFDEWAKGKPEYEGLIAKLDKLYAELEPYAYAMDYYGESIRANEIIAFADQLKGEMDRGASTERTSAMIDGFFKNYYQPIDKESFCLLLEQSAQKVPDSFKPAYYFEQMEKYGSVENWVESIFRESALTSPEKAKALMSSAAASGDAWEVLSYDPAFAFSNAFKSHYITEIQKPYNSINSQITLLYRTYMRGQMEFDTERDFFPDANSTLRIAYGQIAGYAPADGIIYTPVSTLEGVMQKDNPDIFDYNIPQALRDIHAAKDYGKWECNGTVPVCFIANNHTTGGNSGSPVIDADGNLIGINFDRVWEGTMSDIVFDPEICRNISLDMRYVLFIIDKLAHAERILDEIEVVR